MIAKPGGSSRTNSRRFASVLATRFGHTSTPPSNRRVSSGIRYDLPSSYTMLGVKMPSFRSTLAIWFAMVNRHRNYRRHWQVR